ncbi:t-SNARE affecting a late Golgi compartment protein 2 [Entomophthora muscae]|uniref:t-SNARE affecting a late Golgi compartment protein 2 n=2 Tax=Entomophthora muscae TaxID=34485 RepID=A0ACC2TR52_9FUNG|nr:t-SNARE affecting a late Golgi compartment protein 2 [Entomophthora muscae]
MATRDRTKLFLQFRKSYGHALTSQDTRRSRARDDDMRAKAPLLRKDDEGLGSELYELEEMGLIISSSDETGGPKSSRAKREGYQVIDIDSVSPLWVDIKDEINSEIDSFDKNFSKLESLHKKRLLPGFQDRSEEEKEINDLAEIMFGQLKKCHGRTRLLGQPNVAQEAPLIVKNAQISLATRLQELSTQLQNRQSSYLEKLQAREKQGGPFQNESAMLFEDQPQLQLVQEELGSWEEELIAQREREVATISDSISQLADLFRSLQTMVIDQGTLLDRIDYNVESVAENVKDAVKELQTTVNQQRSDKSKYCILILLVLIVFMIVLIIFKALSRHQD